ncbi:sulfotransferase domain-containing protein [Streptomyces sp. ISL-44]|uniref:sulfotransferase domain-containing protein n=1 Tax=Streptomyces sp. ISL-44 TaxID=2819184 RepID=UPI0027E242E2|nr:sulfotransferase domain-containing protein [Streptomyces sp. ISL-44]
MKGQAELSSERVFVISPRKSGTHLVQELLVHLGYHVYGEPVPPAAGRPAFSIRERIDMAERFLDPAEFEALDHEGDRDAFVHTTDQVWLQLAWAWQTRLAVTPLAHVQAVAPEARFGPKMRPEIWTAPFSTTPAGVSWIFHSVDVWRMDNTFLSEWVNTGSPKVILNYRDPRDVLVSLVDFFSRNNGLKFMRYPESAIFGPVLESIEDYGNKLDYAMSDPQMPLLSDFESAISFLHHPNVCHVSFEELVGPQGGGSRAVQLAAVKRVANWLDHDVDPASVADLLFNPQSFTLNKGRIGRWREAFSPAHVERFEARFGHLLDSFGYAREAGQ